MSKLSKLQKLRFLSVIVEDEDFKPLLSCVHLTEFEAPYAPDYILNFVHKNALMFEYN